MNRIDITFANLKEQKRKALIPFITAGDPALDATVPMMHALVKAGVDIVELGVPFSDPMADGPTIQLASERALAHNTTLRDVLAMVAEFRQTNNETPVVLMGYLNPVERMGYEAFAEECKKVGVDGVLLVDLPPEEAVDVEQYFKSRDVGMIHLIAPTTTDERIKIIGQVSTGYVYYVSVKGVTGSKAIDLNDVSQNLERIRKHISIPVGVGFGISNGETAAAVASVSDGVIVGSALVNLIAANSKDPQAAQEAVSELVISMRTALDAL